MEIGKLYQSIDGDYFVLVLKVESSILRIQSIDVQRYTLVVLYKDQVTTLIGWAKSYFNFIFKEIK